MQKKKRRFQLLRILLLLIMVVCLIPVGQAYYLSIQHEKQQEQLRNMLKEGNPAQNEALNQEDPTGQRKSSGQAKITGSDTEKRKNEVLDKRPILKKYQNLWKKNKDMIGWLTVEGTEIDHPVMQCKDDEFYLIHNFYKEKDKYGCLYVKSMADVNTPGANFIIYGHNMRDGSMFGTLGEYGEKAFYKEHPLVSFDTLYEARTYEILSVFQIDIGDAQAFPYYQFYQAEDEKEFMEFYRNVKALSLYDTGVGAEFGDTFLTLSTCSGMGEDGRFVVVAKRVVD